jgi:hypothetical protein
LAAPPGSWWPSSVPSLEEENRSWSSWYVKQTFRRASNHISPLMSGCFWYDDRERKTEKKISPVTERKKELIPVLRERKKYTGTKERKLYRHERTKEIYRYERTKERYTGTKERKKEIPVRKNERKIYHRYERKKNIPVRKKERKIYLHEADVDALEVC